MRIAVTGAHGVGKTTFIDDFTTAHGNYESVAEPYWLLDQQGVPFSNGAAIPDLEKQLTESCRLIESQASSRDVIFDRCPLDFIAYLEVVSASENFEWLPSGRALAGISKALAVLDVLIFIPLVKPDDISIRIEMPRLRSQVDRRLKTMLQEDDLGLLQDGPAIIEVTGSQTQRLGMASRALGLR